MNTGLSETPMTFERFESRTVLTATLKMQTALSIGARASLEPTGTDLPVIKDPSGMPFIPGSSLKGVMRSQMERVLNSLNGEITYFNVCDPFNKQCVTPKDRDDFADCVEKLTQDANEGGLNKDEELTRKIWEKSCTVCRLFGSPWIASRLAFKDSPLKNAQEMLNVTQIRDGVGIDRDRGAAKDGIKYDFEVVSPDAQFDISILAENVEQWEIGLLLAIMRPWQEGYLPIGGKSTRGPGWGKLVDISIERVEVEGLLDYLLKGRMKAISPDIFIQSFKEKFSLEA